MSFIVQQCGLEEPDEDDPCQSIRARICKLVFQTKEECRIRKLKERIIDVKPREIINPLAEEFGLIGAPLSQRLLGRAVVEGALGDEMVVGWM